MYNNGAISVNAQVTGKSHLTFNLMDDYVRLGSYAGALNTTLPGFTEEMNASGGGVTWTRQWDAKTSVSLNYNYRRQILSLGADSNYNSVGLGISRIIKPGLSFSIEGGPGWDQSAVQTANGSQRRALTTAQGTAQLYKNFRSGGIAVSFNRNSQYNGIISNGYNNRYDVSVNQRLFTRWNVLVSGSYIQQQFIGARTSTGELGWAQLGYMLTRNWSVFTGYRYLNLSRNQAWSGPQQMVAAGIRWAWQPQNAHR